MLAAPALADPYEIRDVRVDVTAETAAKARTQARAQAQRKAFARLLERITLFEDRERLPLLAGDELEILIRDFEVAGEKSSAVRYLARLHFHFKAGEVRSLLRDYDLPFAETMSKPLLVLPLYQTVGPAGLWDDSNPWRDAWAGLPRSDSLVPVVMALGDLEDVRTLSAEMAVAGDTERLMDLARRYDAASVLVPYAALRIDPYQARTVLEVRVSRFGDAGPEQTYARSFAALEGEEADALLTRAAAEIARSVEDSWKRDNLVRFGSQGATEATVPITGLKDWLAIKRRLEGISVVRKVDVVLMSREEVKILVNHIGDAEQLVVALRQADLDLGWDGLRWVLVRAGTAVAPTYR